LQVFKKSTKISWSAKKPFNLGGIKDLSFSEIKIRAKFATPYSSLVDVEKLKEVFPVKNNLKIEIVEGELLCQGEKMEEFRDKGTEIIVAVTAITVFAK